MGERDTSRANAEARAETAAHGSRAAADSALLRFLAAAAYHEAASENETTDHGDKEAIDEPPTTAGRPGTERR